MKSIDEYIQALSDKQLNTAFLEYKNWRETGILENGIIRETNQMYKDDQNVDLRLDGLIEPLLYEIAKRHFEL